MEKIRVLKNEDEIIKAYREYGSDISKNFVAFYHGGLDAIIVDSKFMMIHFFDRQVHRGYAVFDTCGMQNLKLYLFKEHMIRFFNSMKLAKLHCPKTPGQIKSIMSQIASLSGKKSLSFRYWCSRGSNDLDIVTPGNVPCVFYLIATKGRPVYIHTGMQKAFTIKMEVKNPYLAEMKSTNYLLNAMAADEAGDKGGFGIMTTDEGYVTEAAVQAVGFVLRDGTYYAPPYYRALRSITQDKVLDFIQKHLMKSGLITGISKMKKTVKELKKEAVEMILMGSERVTPVRMWDEKIISEKPGPVTTELMKLFEEDYKNPEMSSEVTITKM